MKRRLREQFIMLYERGFHTFYITGMLGVGIWSGEILASLKKEPSYQELKIVVMIPFVGHDKGWDERSKKRLAFIRSFAESIVIGDTLEGANFRAQNQYLISHADCLLAVYDNVPDMRSRMARMVEDAYQKGIPVICIHPDTSDVSGNFT